MAALIHFDVSSSTSFFSLVLTSFLHMQQKNLFVVIHAYVFKCTLFNKKIVFNMFLPLKNKKMEKTNPCQLYVRSDHLSMPPIPS
jgi:hypothetical protein